jgi:hypothetical protein
VGCHCAFCQCDGLKLAFHSVVPCLQYYECAYVVSPCVQKQYTVVAEVNLAYSNILVFLLVYFAPSLSGDNTMLKVLLDALWFNPESFHFLHNFLWIVSQVNFYPVHTLFFIYIISKPSPPPLQALQVYHIISTLLNVPVFAYLLQGFLS